MNLHQASLQLERAARAYARSAVPLSAQRPPYLFGPPGVGKTAIVSQVAESLGLGFAAYTMTHHTRQSALGLPMIVHRTLNGEDRAVTEYTMSEIAAAVWEKAEAGASAGILFLDEINCVSESLMPAMLQLLQYKTFGTHALPRGWMLVCAGNPPRYNRYAHAFDAVVMDRLRLIEVEPDLDSWRAYAAKRGVDPEVLSYLAVNGDDFYRWDGDRVVTARSWTDLSDMMVALKDAGDAPDDDLFAQYLQIDEVAERFSLYHRLCQSLGAGLDEAVESGDARRLRELPFDEALYAALLLSGRIKARAEAVHRLSADADRLEHFALGVARELGEGGDVHAQCLTHIERLKAARAALRNAGALSEAADAEEGRQIARLTALTESLRLCPNDQAMDALARAAQRERETAQSAENAFALRAEDALAFASASFPDPNVRLLFINDLSGHEAAHRLLSAHAPDYPSLKTTIKEVKP